MSLLIVCPKSKGNTYNLSRYIVNNSDAELFVINKNETSDLKKYKSIILCSGVYGDKVHKDLIGWLGQIEKTSINENAKFYMFLTWFGRGQSDKNAIKEVKNILGKNNLNLEDDYMTCYGGKGIIRSSHPNKEECERVLNWVKLKNKHNGNDRLEFNGKLEITRDGSRPVKKSNILT